MDGYAAYGRVDRRRVVAAGATFPVREDWPQRDLVAVDADDPASRAPTARQRLRERLTAAREQWTMTTFFLFDANSWR